jgi:ribonuclease P protein component
MTSACRFNRHQRLSKTVEFRYVFAQPSKSTDLYFTVLARANRLTYARLGLAIARKRIKSAVARNRIKRLIRESFRQHQAILAGLDCVVLARSELEPISNLILFQSLAKHWHKLSSIVVSQ